MENHHNTPLLLLDRKDVVLVKPSKPTPSGVLSLSSIDNSPTHECLCQTVHVFRSKVDTSSSMSGQADPACVIKEALSQALVYYYPLAGKLNKCSDGKLQINCTADGVPFLEATANNSQLSSLHYLDGNDVEVAKQFVFNFLSEDDSGYHPLLLQVTKFSCGGFTIGMSLSHSVCDGSGAAQFFRALAELASGKSEPSVKPVWERERLMGKAPTDEPLQFPSLAISPYLPTTDILHACFYVSSESIKTLKTSLIEEHCGTNESFTTVEVLGAYVWRSRFRALKLNPDQQTLFSMAVGIRNRLNSPPLPDGYYGNAFVSATVVLMGGELNEEPLSKVAKLIKESKKVASDREYIMNSLSIFEKFREHNIKIEASTGGSMVLTDWRQLGFLQEEEVAVGAINVNFVPLPVNLFPHVDLCLFLPPSKVDDPSRKGGVRVLVSFPRAAMAKFEEEMDALCKLGDDGSLCKL